MNKIICAVLFFLATGAAQATINSGFESGDLNGWTTNLSGGTAEAISSASIDSFFFYTNTTYLPVEGSYFLALSGGAADEWQIVSQSVTLAAGDSLSGNVAFNWGDFWPYEDGVRVRVLDASGAEVAVPFYDDGSAHWIGYDGPWTSWEWLALSGGIYTLEYGVRDTIAEGGLETTYGYFDAPVIFNGDVPEPTSIALLGAALLGLGLSRRKR